VAEHHDIASLEKRLTALEYYNHRLSRQCRLLRFFSVCSLAGIVLMGGAEVSGLDIFGSGQAGDSRSGSMREGDAHNTLRVRDFILEDEDGTMRARITAKKDGGVLQQFFDRNGTERVRSGIEDDGTARHRMFDEAGTKRLSSAVTLNSAKEADVGTAIFNKKGEVQLSFGASPGKERDAVSFDLFHNKDKVAWSVGMGDDGFGENFSAENSKATLSFGLTKEEEPGLSIFDKDGKSRVAMYIKKDATALIGVFDREEKARAYFSTDPQGVAIQAVGDGRFRRVTSLITKEGFASQIIYDNAGRARIVSSTSAEGKTGQVFLDSQGKELSTTSISSNDQFEAYAQKTSSQQFKENLEWIMLGLKGLEALRNLRPAQTQE
jgi:hypothetical protein